MYKELFSVEDKGIYGKIYGLFLSIESAWEFKKILIEYGLKDESLIIVRRDSEIDMEYGERDIYQ